MSIKPPNDVIEHNFLNSSFYIEKKWFYGFVCVSMASFFIMIRFIGMDWFLSVFKRKYLRLSVFRLRNSQQNALLKFSSVKVDPKQDYYRLHVFNVSFIFYTTLSSYHVCLWRWWALSTEHVPYISLSPLILFKGWAKMYSTCLYCNRCGKLLEWV